MAKQNRPSKPNNPQAQRPNVPPRPQAQPKPAPKAEKQPRFQFTQVTWLSLILAAITFIVYSNTIGNGFVLDDVMVIKDNFIVPQGAKMIPDILKTLRLSGYANMSNEYRPLSLVMFAIECDLNKAFSEDHSPFHPAIHHFMNVLVFMGCVTGLFTFLNKLFDRKKIAVAFIAALLFALHPIHTEVVANIKSRDELLCFFFAFVSLNAFANYMRSGNTKQLVWGALAFFLSFLSKETVITFLAVVPMIYFFYINDDRKRSIHVTVATVAITGLYLLIRQSIVKATGNGEFPINFVDNMLVNTPADKSRLATEILIMGHYIRLLFVPYPLIIDRSFASIPYVTFGNPWVILPLLVYLALAVFSVKRLLENKRDPWAFAILFFLATLSLFTNIVIMLASTFAERFLFFCSVGLCLAVALAIEKWIIRKADADINDIKVGKVLAVLAPICIVFSIITYGRNNDWKDSYHLYKADADKLPENTRLNYYVASELQKMCGAETKDTVKAKQLNDQSMVYLRQSLKIYPDNTDAQAEIGAAFFRAKQYDSSALHLKRALELNPTKSNALANLGTLYMTMVDYPNALIYYRRTNQVDPRNVVAQFNGGVCYYQLKKPDSAIINFKNTIILQPEFYDYKSYQFIGIIYNEMGKRDSAAMYENMYQNIIKQAQQQAAH